MNITSINSKHQSNVKKATSWLNKYDVANDLRNLASDQVDDYENCPVWKKHNKSCEKSFDKYLEYYDELPQREQQNIDQNWSY